MATEDRTRVHLLERDGTPAEIVNLHGAADLLRHRLAQSRIAEAKRLVEEAQNLLGRAARNLCPIIGAIPKHRRAGALYVQVERFWHDLEKFERTGRYEMDGDARGLAERGEVER